MDGLYIAAVAQRSRFARIHRIAAAAPAAISGKGFCGRSRRCMLDRAPLGKSLRPHLGSTCPAAMPTAGTQVAPSSQVALPAIIPH